MNNINPYDKIHIGALIKYLFIRIFSNKYLITIFNLGATSLVTLLASKGYLLNDDTKYLFVICVLVQIVINILSIIADKTKNNSEQTYIYLNDVYNIQSHINSKTASNLYRVNKKIINIVKDMKCEKGAINSIADFQNLSFLICNELYNFIEKHFDCGACEITIFQRFLNKNSEEYVKMIAYKNTQDTAPSSYINEFKLNTSDNHKPVFISLFNDLNAETIILHNQESVVKEFVYLDGSENREKKICQYIGIPIKTNRNKIEIILQIDVSKEKSLGRTYNDLKQFSDQILRPFCNLLHCSYERDLILNKFYDILEENIIIKGKYYEK